MSDKRKHMKKDDKHTLTKRSVTQYVRLAKDLCYSQATIDAILKSTSVLECERILKDAREKQ